MRALPSRPEHPPKAPYLNNHHLGHWVMPEEFLGTQIFKSKQTIAVPVFFKKILTLKPTFPVHILFQLKERHLTLQSVILHFAVKFKPRANVNVVN